VIQRPTELDGLYTCSEHPTFQGDEVAAAMHLRTVHSDVWQRLAGMSVEPVPVTKPQPSPSRRTAPSRTNKRRRDRRRS
jgi:hypothetical protein